MPMTRTEARADTTARPRSQTASRAAFPLSGAVIERAVLVFILLAALGFGFAGIKKNLPFTREVDEGIFVRTAVGIAASGDLNPHWFGNPGSTVIYPLAAAYHAWHAVTDGGDIIPADGDIRGNYDADTDDYYYIGRSLPILYFVGAVLLTYLIGKRAFNATVGLVAALIIAVNPITIEHAQIVRTDTAGAFFLLLSLWLILRLYDRPSNTNRVLAGAAIGLAFSSRYFTIVLVPVLALAEIFIVLRRRSEHPLAIRDVAVPFIGPAVAFAAFVLTTPYFFLDFDTARETIRREARTTHLGADGLSRPENLRWYLTDAIPSAITVPVALLALAGSAVALFRHKPKHLFCLLTVAAFLAGISYSALHWERWLVPVLPIIAILGAFAVYEAVTYVRGRSRIPPAAAAAAVLVIVAALVANPVSDVVLHDVRAASPSTNVAARGWIIDNLPPGARIAGETYTAPLTGTNFRYSEEFSLFQRNTLDGYRGAGVEYIVASSNMYDRYYADPDLYAGIIEQYDALFAEEQLEEFRPGDTRGGPTIRIYELDAPD
jgi:hypothetical protein